MDEEHGTDHSTAGLSAERIGRNEAIARAANDRIQVVAEAGGIEESIPFVCECADRACTDIVRLSLEAYAEIRSEPRLFLNVPGHQAAAQGWAQVVEEHDGYVVTEKIGPAGDVAERLEGELDPATAAPDIDEPRHRDDDRV